MDGDGDEAGRSGDGGGARGARRCPRCEVCGRAVRVRGLGEVGVWCAGCMGDALPFVGLLSEGEFRGALREYGRGLGSRAAEFMDLRLDPFDEEVRGALGGLGEAHGGCGYIVDIRLCPKKFKNPHIPTLFEQ